MGNKRVMLTNGLGHAIDDELHGAKRFFDLFTGSGSVARHVSSRNRLPVIAVDLQRFAVALADGVVSRTEPVGEAELISWLARAEATLQREDRLREAARLQILMESSLSPHLVEECRQFCQDDGSGPIESAYGGHYFSPLQAMKLDALRRCLPKEGDAWKVALASLIEGASTCAAAPGHTAQPFQPTVTALPYLREAWLRDVQLPIRSSFLAIGATAALSKGRSFVGDAFDVADSLQDGDVAFIDPPYSSVHYSRFYHVLETICAGDPVEVSGRGRYPSAAKRPRSDFSMRGQAAGAFAKLLEKVASKGARAIVTFPAGLASNKVSGADVAEICEEFFAIEQQIVTGRFSTLGGNLTNRTARQTSRELILRLRPR